MRELKNVVTEMRTGSSAASMEPGLLAFYLPQFHPIPENDLWWGPGFTEWRSVVKARAQFRGHYQPHIPADLGFYDLRLPEARSAQAALARQHGIQGFCYYHYWFNGRRLLGRPLDEVLASGEPDLPFCICWANEDWTRAWDGRSGDVLIGQRYSEDDDRKHIRWLARVFADDRYIRVGGRPLFLIYRASLLPDPMRSTTIWREELDRLGVGEPLLCRVESFGNERGNPALLGFDAAVDFQPDWTSVGALRQTRPRGAHGVGLKRTASVARRVYDYGAVAERMLARPRVPYRRFGCVTPSWDNTPRRPRDGVVLTGSTPELYERWLRTTIDRAVPEPSGERLVFINAWNEWAEGNHLEPCERWGRGYLEATERALGDSPTRIQEAEATAPASVPPFPTSTAQDTEGKQ